MSLGPDFFQHLAAQGAALHARVLSRDDAHLRPDRLSKAAAGRLRSGIAALESWLRRVILLMALVLEPGLVANGRPWTRTHRIRLGRRPAGLRIFKDSRWPGQRPFPARGDTRGDGPRAVWAAPLLARLAALKALLDAPEARARRLAFHLARRKPGPLRARPCRGAASGRPFSTEAGTLHDAMAAAIWERSRARPPPLGPAIRAGPRIRSL